MGFKCDVCDSEPGAVFCFADNAVMCSGCDERFHNANKLAQKHERVALTPQKAATMCDICQEETAVMFCCEDRALLCRRCDVMIHKANALTAQHQRYLLSGMQPGLDLLPSSSTAASSSDSLAKAGEASPTGSLAKPGTPTGNELLPPPEPKGHRRAADPTSALDQAASSLMQASAFAPVAAQQQQQHLHTNGLSMSSAASLGLNSWEPGPSTSALGMPSDANQAGSSASGFTMAAELLAMPSLPDVYTAKDIDAAWFTDGACGFDELDDADLGSLLQVPDLDFSNPGALDTPRGFTSGSASRRMGLSSPQYELGSLSEDGVVPDYSTQRYSKRARR